MFQGRSLVLLAKLKGLIDVYHFKYKSVEKWDLDWYTFGVNSFPSKGKIKKNLPSCIFAVSFYEM